jgi:hypothetical protein
MLQFRHVKRLRRHATWAEPLAGGATGAGLVCFTTTLTKTYFYKPMSLGNHQMPSPATKQENKYFSIEDDGDSYQVCFYSGLVQVAGAFIPDSGTGDSLDLAMQLGLAYGKPIAASNLSQQH